MPTRRAMLTMAGAAMMPGPALAEPDAALAAALAAAHRTPKFVGRDRARHPLEELSFFGLRPEASVIEIWPGGGYWTEILAPYLRERGRYVVVLPNPSEDGGSPGAIEDAGRALTSKLAGGPAAYEHLTFTRMQGSAHDIVGIQPADFVLTFRNLHSWMADGDADAVLLAFNRALKPGGVLGMEDHRARPDRPQDPKARSGYVRQDAAIEIARRAGFAFEASSEIGANPRDTTDWPEGVWTLPPTYRLGDKDREKYAAVGEADNFTLRFRKPD